jgi:hypothetical protein
MTLSRLACIWSKCLRGKGAYARKDGIVQVFRRSKSEWNGAGQADSDTEWFKGDLPFIFKWKAQAVLEKEVARVQQQMQQQMQQQQMQQMQQQIAREREIAEVTAKMTEEKAAREKDVAVLEERLSYANQETLRSKGLLTSRGVLEFALRQVHHERNAHQRFVARSACDTLDKTPPREKTEAWKLKECFETICKQYPRSRLARMSLGKAYAEVFSVLSQDIHGYPWSGGSVRVTSG